MTEFQINEEKKSVTCIIKSHDHMGNEETLMGYCECKEGDTFDVEKGKHIAKLKAIMKARLKDTKDAAFIAAFAKKIYLEAKENFEKEEHKFDKLMNELEELTELDYMDMYQYEAPEQLLPKINLDKSLVVDGEIVVK